MASTGPAQSPKRRDPSADREEADRLVITPLGAGSELGQSCVLQGQNRVGTVTSPTSLFVPRRFNFFDFISLLFALSGSFLCDWQFDCGIHPAYSGMAALPYFDEIDPSTVDILLVTQHVFCPCYSLKVLVPSELLFPVHDIMYLPCLCYS